MKIKTDGYPFYISYIRYKYQQNNRKKEKLQRINYKTKPTDAIYLAMNLGAQRQGKGGRDQMISPYGIFVL